jgi:hypothetical protein
MKNHNSFRAFALATLCIISAYSYAQNKQISTQNATLTIYNQ